MKRHIRTSGTERSWAVAAAAVALGILLAACGSDPEPVMISLEASSSLGDDIEVTYETGDGEVTEVVASPWSLDFEQSGTFSATLEVRNTGLTGEVRCEVQSGAFPPLSTGGEAAALCRAHVSKQGGTTSVSTSTDFELFVRNGDGEPVELPESLPEPQRAEADTVTQLDERRVLLSGHKGVHLLDTETGIVDLVPGSNDFGNPLDIAMDDDGVVYALNIFKDLLQSLPDADSDLVDIAEFPDESPNGLWLVDDQLLVLLSQSDHLVSVGLDGAERWRYEFPQPTTNVRLASLGDGRVIVGSDDSTLVGLDLDTGVQTFEWPLRDEIASIVRRDDLVFLSFFDGGDGGTVAIPVSGLDDINTASSFQLPGYNVVFDPSGTPYSANDTTVSRLDPVTFEVDRSIELAGSRLVAVGDEMLFTAERAGSSGDDVMISALPLSLFD